MTPAQAFAFRNPGFSYKAADDPRFNRLLDAPGDKAGETAWRVILFIDASTGPGNPERWPCWHCSVVYGEMIRQVARPAAPMFGLPKQWQGRLGFRTNWKGQREVILIPNKAKTLKEIEAYAATGRTAADATRWQIPLACEMPEWEIRWPHARFRSAEALIRRELAGVGEPDTLRISDRHELMAEARRQLIPPNEIVGLPGRCRLTYAEALECLPQEHLAKFSVLGGLMTKAPNAGSRGKAS